jgi:hypothetical protein
VLSADLHYLHWSTAYSHALQNVMTRLA